MHHYKLSAFGYEAWITAEFGADIARLTYEGKDILIPLNTEEEREINPYLHGGPLLLPANRTVKGQFSFDGKTWELPVNEPSNGCHLHGFLHRQTFRVVEATDTLWAGEYENHGEIFPFPFAIRVEYEITREGFVSRYAIRNLAKGKAPLVFALHTTFCEPDYFQVPIGICQERYDNCVPTGRYVPLNEHQQGYERGTASADYPVFGYYTAKGREAVIGDMVYRVSELFDHWILYNGGGKGGFLCVEPQCGEVNGLNGDCKIMDPGETVHFHTVIQKR